MALGPADPARIDRRLHTPDKDWQNLEPEERPGQAVPVLPEGSDNVIFTLNSLTIEGMSAYTEEEVAGFYTSYIGQEIALSTLFDIMATLQQKYLEDGYTITKVFIPNQSIESGAAKLVVVEGYVAEIDIDPAILPAPIIADTKRLILAMHPLNMLELERLILLLNDLPDLNVSAVLAKLTPDAPEAIPSGAVRLRLQKNPEKYSYGEASFDNYGSVFLGPYEVSLTARAPHIGPNYSELTGSTVFTTSANEQKYGYLQYDMPLFGASGTTLSLAASYAVTNPGDELKTLEIEGNSKSLIANISHYLIRQRDESLAISASFEFKNSETDILQQDLYNDRQRILTTEVNYGFSDSWDGLNVIDFQYGKGLDIWGTREAGSENLSRLDGHPDFDKFNLFLARLQNLPYDLGLYTSLRGQYSAKPLLSSEEMSFGGRSLGRGYNPAEITGDRGIAASAELRLNNAAHLAGLDIQLQHYAFYDVGKLWNIDNNDTIGISAASAGLGTRFFEGDSWSGDINLAFPLTREPENAPSYAENFGPRLLFSVSHKF